MPKPYPRHLVTVTVTELRVGHTGHYGCGAHSRSPPFDTGPPRCEPTRTPTVPQRCDQRLRRPVGVQLGCRRGELNLEHTAVLLGELVLSDGSSGPAGHG
jgi:hypothetical protein